VAGVSRAAGPSPFLWAFLGVATFFEGFDFIALTQVLPELRAEWGLSEAQGGWLVGVCNIGPVLAFFLVRQADRVGRSTVLAWTIAGYTLGSLASGLAPTAWAFALAQLVARTFLIAEWAVCMVYAAEVWPADRRATAIGGLQALAAVGAVVCAALTPVLLQSPWGWRTVYFVGALPLALLAVARRAMPESARFVAPTAPTPLGRILAGPWRGRVLQLAALWFFTYAGTHLALTFWKEYAIHEARLGDAAVGRTLAIASLVSMPLVFGVGRLLDRWGRRVGALLVYPVAATGVVGAFTLTDPVLLTVAMTLVIFGCSAVLPVLEAFTTELFPTEQRGDAFGWSNNLLGRQANVFLPPLVGWLAADLGWGPTVAASALFLGVALAGIWRWLPETRARELEETARLG